MPLLHPLSHFSTPSITIKMRRSCITCRSFAVRASEEARCCLLKTIRQQIIQDPIKEEIEMKAATVSGAPINRVVVGRIMFLEAVVDHGRLALNRQCPRPLLTQEHAWPELGRVDPIRTADQQNSRNCWRMLITRRQPPLRAREIGYDLSNVELQLRRRRKGVHLRPSSAMFFRCANCN